MIEKLKSMKAFLKNDITFKCLQDYVASIEDLHIKFIKYDNLLKTPKMIIPGWYNEEHNIYVFESEYKKEVKKFGIQFKYGNYIFSTF